MDRHVRWLRRRIIASIATQSAETFVVVAVAAFALMQWGTDEGPLGSLFASVVIGQHTTSRSTANPRTTD